MRNMILTAAAAVSLAAFPAVASAQQGAQVSAAARSQTPAAQIEYVSNARVQTTPAQGAPGEYPVCNAQRKDSCVNAWEAGKRGKDVTKPLDHWPGHPASEMPDKPNR